MEEEPNGPNENNKDKSPKKNVNKHQDNHDKNRQEQIQSISVNYKAFMQESLMFYKLKNELLAQILFVSTLVILFFSETLHFSNKSVFIANILFSIYLCAYLKDLKNQEYTIKSILFNTLKKLFRILSISIVNFIIFIAFSNIFLFIPGIFLGITMIFNLCYVVDKNYSLSRSIEDSHEDTKDQKFNLFLIILKVLLPLFAITLLVLMIVIKVAPYAFPFIFYFAYTIIMLIIHRMTALIYHSIIYSHSKKTFENLGK